MTKVGEVQTISGLSRLGRIHSTDRPPPISFSCKRMPLERQSRKDNRLRLLKIRHRVLKREIAGRRAKRSACYDFNTWLTNRVGCHASDAVRALERIINGQILEEGFKKYKAACEENMMPLETCRSELDRIRFESFLLTKKIARYYHRLRDLVSSGLHELGRELSEDGEKDEALYEAFNHSLGQRKGDHRQGAAASSDTNPDDDEP